MGSLFAIENKATRFQYVTAYLLSFVVITILYSNIMEILEFAQSEIEFKIIFYGILSIVGILLLIFMVWRLNDMGKSRWYILIAFIPILNTIFGIVLCFYPPSKLPNKDKTNDYIDALENEIINTKENNEITGIERMKVLAGDMIDDIISTDKHTRIHESYDEFMQVFKDFSSFKEYEEAFTVVISRYRSNYKIIVMREDSSFSAYWEPATLEDIMGL